MVRDWSAINMLTRSVPGYITKMTKTSFNKIENRCTRSFCQKTNGNALYLSFLSFCHFQVPKRDNSSLALNGLSDARWCEIQNYIWQWSAAVLLSYARQSTLLWDSCYWFMRQLGQVLGIKPCGCCSRWLYKIVRTVWIRAKMFFWWCRPFTSYVEV